MKKSNGIITSTLDVVLFSVTTFISITISVKYNAFGQFYKRNCKTIVLLCNGSAFSFKAAMYLFVMNNISPLYLIVL